MPDEDDSLGAVLNTTRLTYQHAATQLLGKEGCWIFWWKFPFLILAEYQILNAQIE